MEAHETAGFGLPWPLMQHVFRRNPKCAHEYELLMQEVRKVMPDIVKRLDVITDKLFPILTFNEICDLEEAGISYEEIAAMVESGHSRNEILKKIKLKTLLLPQEKTIHSRP